LKKTGAKLPGGEEGFWVIEQKAGHVNWQDVNSLVRPGVVRLFTYQTVSRGANGVLYFFWRQPRIGPEKFYGGILTHDGRGENRVYKEISQIGEEFKRLAPGLQGTKVTAEACILYSHENDWTLSLPRQPTKAFQFARARPAFPQRPARSQHPVDFARPTEDLSKYKLVIAPSLCLLAGGEADALKLYVQNGGTLVATCNSGLVDEHHMAAETGFPHDLTDVFGMEVTEFDPMPPEEENHLAFKGNFHTSQMHTARTVVRRDRAQRLPDAGHVHQGLLRRAPAMTMNTFGRGQGHLYRHHFAAGLLLRPCHLAAQHLPAASLLKVPDTVEVSLRQKADTKLYFLLNHQNTPVRINFYKPMHDFLTERTFSGNYDLPPHGVLVLDETVLEENSSHPVVPGR
jgi:beta-galactosidase